jgi:hypothetical protein
MDGSDGPNDTFVLKVQVFNEVTGEFKYEMTPSIDFTNITKDYQECNFISLGLGVATSERKRVIVFGMTEANTTIIYEFNAETGAKLYEIKFPRLVDNYTWATPGYVCR